MPQLIPILSLLAAFTVIPVLSTAEEAPAGTTIEARLQNATGTRISHSGDGLDAIVIAPVFLGDILLIPQHAVISGSVASVQRLGLGLKHRKALIRYCFDRLRMPDGRMFAIATRLERVETAKERVNGEGVVGGIHPAANLSSTISSYALPVLFATPFVGATAMALKVLIARSPDPEIYFPAGAEIVLRLTAPVSLPVHWAAASTVRPLSAEDLEAAERSLQSSPLRRTENRGRPSDPVNIVILGTRNQLNRVFRGAGWAGVEPRSIMSMYRLYCSLSERTGYDRAPMGKLTLNGLPASLAYQKSLNTVAKRHHIRLWTLQPDAPEVWLGAATEDLSYGFRRMRLTHSSSPSIDDERAKVVNDLAFTGCVQAGGLLALPSLPESGSDGEPSIVTDGHVAVLRLNDCRAPHRMPLAVPPAHSGFIARSWMSLRGDIAHSDAILLGLSATKLFTAASDTHSAVAAPRSFPESSKSLMKSPLVRSSVLDASITIDSQH